MESPYEAAGGADGIHEIARAWHQRVLADPVVSHAFSHGFRDDHTDRLAAYLGEALGGPPTYTASLGDHSSVVRMHSGNGTHEEMDRRAIACFEAALAEVGLDGEVARTLLEYFAWATTVAMAGYPDAASVVPEDLAMPHWSWRGLES